MALEKREQQEGGDYSKVVGLAECKVIAVCPTLDQLKKLLGSDKLDKEPQYTGEKDGKDYADIVFWVEVLKTGRKYPCKFRITNEVKVWEKSGKTVWINQTLSTSTVATENDLQGWFKEFYKSKTDKTVVGKAKYRKALQGESELAEFLKNWITQANWFSPNTDILDDMLPTKKLMMGKVDGIREYVDSDWVGTVVLPFYVAMVEKNGEKKYYQNIGKDSAPGWLMKKINLSIQQNSWDADKTIKKLKDNLVGQYGIASNGANAFILDHLQEYNESMFQNMTDETIRHEGGSSPSDMEY